MTLSVPSYAMTTVEPDVQLFDSDQTFSRKGLTQAGYAIFFPGSDPEQGLKEWQRMTPLEKLSFLEQNGDPLPRGLWALQRNDDLVRGLRKSNPRITDTTVNAVLGTLGPELVRKCANERPRDDVDFCVFHLGQVATCSELAAAERRVQWCIENQNNPDAASQCSLID